MTMGTALPPFIQTTSHVRLAEEHPLAPAQGLAMGILLALPLWVGIILVVRALISID